MKAIIIVDMQNDFSETGTLPVPGFSLIISDLNQRIKWAKENKLLVIATRDWHPKNHISFNEWPEHCLMNEFGSEIHKDIDKANIDHILNKGSDQNIDSYSIFKDNAGNWLSEAKDILIKANVKDIEIIGVAGDYCVYFTAIDANELGFNVTVNNSIVKYIDKDSIEKIKQTYSEKGIKVI